MAASGTRWRPAATYISAEDHLRLMTRVARMYHERGLRQGAIADELHISQARVSRLLKRAGEVGIVRTTVALPNGVHTDLEERLERAFGLREAVVVDVATGSDRALLSALGSATAEYLTATLLGGDRLGISSWSASLLAAVGALRPFRTSVADTVVQLVGGVGDPKVQMEATRLLEQFAATTGATPIMLPTPGVLGSSGARASLMSDPAVADVVEVWDELTIALVGIGAAEPSELARSSGNSFGGDDLSKLRAAGAVGDICFRFYDIAGDLVDSDFDDRVIGISAETLRRVDRRIAVAGGQNKQSAILGALRGGWINVLITDADTAGALIA